MNEDQINDRALNRHLDAKYGPAEEELYVNAAKQMAKLAERQSAIMDYITVMKLEPWQDTLFGVIDNFQLTSEEAGAMVKAWIDRQSTGEKA